MGTRPCSLSVRELFERLRESLNQLNSLNVPWQIEECKANLYLFACALTCTVDDYLGEAPSGSCEDLLESLPILRDSSSPRAEDNQRRGSPRELSAKIMRGKMEGKMDI